jgi:hypothetical protein
MFQFTGALRPLYVAALIVLLITQGGCSFIARPTQRVWIVPSEPQADVYVDGRHLGSGTVTTRLKKARDHSVMAKVGERVGDAQIRRQISRVGFLDLLAGFVILVPWLGVLGPGFWTLEPETVMVAVPPPGSRTAAP